MFRESQLFLIEQKVAYPNAEVDYSFLPITRKIKATIIYKMAQS